MAKNTRTDYYLGLLSGTSLDGIDCGLFDFNHPIHPVFITGQTFAYPERLKKKLIQSLKTPVFSLSEFGKLDTELGFVFAQAVQDFYKTQIFPKFQITHNQIRAIGSHGQNLWHAPQQPYPCTLQLGNPHIIYAETGIPVISDFRRLDVACGGQGAPLAPLFHQAVFSHGTQKRIICNIGGISNISILSPKNSVLGFDTGPGNTLIDHWTQTYFNQPYDSNGDLAQTGTLNLELLHLFLTDPYFSKKAPKSTGLEYFNLTWVNHYLSQLTSQNNCSKLDILRTLLELTAQTIINSLLEFLEPNTTIYLCGGGAHNQTLVQTLKNILISKNKNFNLKSIQLTDALGIPVDWVEAGLFAWLAYQRMNRKKLSLQPITGNRFKKIQVGVRFD